MTSIITQAKRPARVTLQRLAVASALAAYVAIPTAGAIEVASVLEPIGSPVYDGDQYEKYGYESSWGSGCGAESFTRSPKFSTTGDVPYILGKFAEYTATPNQLYGPGPWTNWSAEKDMRHSLGKLSTMRNILEAKNLWDTYRFWEPERPGCPANANTTRTIDGSCNDPEQTWMGAAGTRFGRMMNPTAPAAQGESEPALVTPNPIDVSRRLLARDTYKEVPFLNLLAASWIQFMVHDWFRHENSRKDFIKIPLRPSDPLRRHGQKEMTVARTEQDSTRKPHEAALGPTFLNTNTHWWDGSQIYGSDDATASRLRTQCDQEDCRPVAGGKLRIDDATGLLPIQPDGFEDTGFRNNWWLGLALMHNLFAKEHNYNAERLQAMYPHMSDQELFDKARMITAAQIAKIHTIEWTPAILPNPSLTVGMNANWAGLNQYMDPPLPVPPPEVSVPYRHVIFGVRGGPRALYKDPVTGKQVPFTMTEEFVSVYRMHPLLPDVVHVKDPVTGKEVAKYPLEQTLNADSRAIEERHGLGTLLYSFGVGKPGALVLNNYPKMMQSIPTPHGLVDLGAIDVLRDRERGVPRYNEFRRQLSLRPLTSIDEITPDLDAVKKLKDVYGYDAGAIERVDLFIGTLAEGHRPRCYGFSETLFQVFTAIATRRLHGDLFYTSRYNADSYTELGLQLIEETKFRGILERHYPELKNTGLRNLQNPFYPWEG